jgi:hypothetical protein
MSYFNKFLDRAKRRAEKTLYGNEILRYEDPFPDRAEVKRDEKIFFVAKIFSWKTKGSHILI